jgi:hypothetical protein
MKVRAAVAWEAKKPLSIEMIEIEKPREGEVLLQVVATGVCHTDAFTLSGDDPEGAFPCVLGHEGGCIVVECGPGVKNLKPGEFSDVVDTEQGYQIFFLQEIVAAKGKPIEDVKPEIEEKLYKEIVEQKFRTWLEDLRQKAHIRIIR